MFTSVRHASVRSLKGISGSGRGEGRQYGEGFSRISNSSPRKKREGIATKEVHCTCCNLLPHGTDIHLNVRRVSPHAWSTMDALVFFTGVHDFSLKCHYFSLAGLAFFRLALDAAARSTVKRLHLKDLILYIDQRWGKKINQFVR